jgi:hypothetical protein
VRERRQVDDRRAARGRSADGSKIQQILPLDAIETHHLVAAPFEEARYWAPTWPRCPVTRMRTPP